MNTLLIASILAFTTDPTTGAPTCEEQLRETQYELSIAEDVLEAAINWAVSVSVDPAGGAAECPPDSEICEAVDFCQGSSDFAGCITLTCSYFENNCL
jgi:hypothetical protein